MRSGWCRGWKSGTEGSSRTNQRRTFSILRVDFSRCSICPVVSPQNHNPSKKDRPLAGSLRARARWRMSDMSLALDRLRGHWRGRGRGRTGGTWAGGEGGVISKGIQRLLKTFEGSKSLTDEREEERGPGLERMAGRAEDGGAGRDRQEGGLGEGLGYGLGCLGV